MGALRGHRLEVGKMSIGAHICAPFQLGIRKKRSPPHCRMVRNFGIHSWPQIPAQQTNQDGHQEKAPTGATESIEELLSHCGPYGVPHTGGSEDLPLPSLHVEGMGSISISLLKMQADALQKITTKVLRGKGPETAVRHFRVHDTLQIWGFHSTLSKNAQIWARTHITADSFGQGKI